MKEIRILSLGAGVQSTTLALLAVHGEIEKPSDAIFADTGWEPKEVMDHLKWLTPVMEEAGIKLHIVSDGSLREDVLQARTSKGFTPMPIYTALNGQSTGMGRRSCTQLYKIKPIVRKQRELIGLKKGERWKKELHGQIVNLMGISVDEVQRAKDNPNKFIRNEFPLLDKRMKRSDCIKWLDDHGYSAPRSACLGCPYHSNKEWKELKENPVYWADIVEFDEGIRSLRSDNSESFTGEQYLHKVCKPIDEVDLRSEEERGQGTLFDAECEGMCGI